MKIITIIALIMVIICQIEFLYLYSSYYGTTDVLARILIALKKHNIEPEGMEVKELGAEDDDEKDDEE